MSTRCLGPEIDPLGGRGRLESVIDNQVPDLRRLDRHAGPGAGAGARVATAASGAGPGPIEKNDLRPKAGARRAVAGRQTGAVGPARTEATLPLRVGSAPNTDYLRRANPARGAFQQDVLKVNRAQSSTASGTTELHGFNYRQRAGS